jgi:hypothetical protein
VLKDGCVSVPLSAKLTGETGQIVTRGGSVMKLVRYKVRDFYRNRIDELYASGAADPRLEGNRKALREILG